MCGVCVCVCVCERERERERETRVCVCVRERECVCVCVRERESGWKVKIREPCDPDNTMITVNIYKNGTVMVQGHLKTFQTDYSAIMKLEKALLSERLSSEQNTQSSNTDLKPIPAESPAQDPSSPPSQIYTCTAGALHKTRDGDGAAQRNRTQTGASH